MGDSSSSSAAYIRMVCVLYHLYKRMVLVIAYFVRALLVQVHHMIEKCICFNLSKEECMDALEKHANVKPVVTSTGTVPAVLASYRACILDTTCIICCFN